MDKFNNGLRTHLTRALKSQSPMGSTIPRAFHNPPSPSIRCYSSAASGSKFLTHPAILRPATPSRQYRCSSFLHDSSASPAKRQMQKTVRETYLTRRRRREGDARSKISTLALSRDDSIPFGTGSAEHESTDTVRQEARDQTESGKSEAKSINWRSRKLVLLAGILLFPVIGGDLADAVLPGLLGVIIYVASSVKMAIRWVKSLGSGNE